MAIIEMDVRCKECNGPMEIDQEFDHPTTRQLPEEPANSKSGWICRVTACANCERAMMKQIRADILKEVKDKVGSIE